MARPKRSDQLNSTVLEAVAPVDLDAVRAARGSLPAPATLGRLSDLFSSLADPTRLRILTALAKRELCVGDLAAATGGSTSAISHQLRLLRERALVRARRDGRLVYYALDDAHVAVLLAQALEHVQHEPGEDA